MALYAAGASLALSAISKMSESNQQASSYKSQAAALGNQASQQIQSGASEANQQVQKGVQVIGQQQAAQGANGVVGGSGSAGTTLVDTGAQADKAANTDIQNAYRQAQSTQYQANIDRASARNAKKGGIFGALLSGTSSGLGMYNATKAAGFGNWKV